MSDQLERRRRRRILNKVSMTIDKWDKAEEQITEAVERAEKAEQEVENLRKELGYIANAERHSFTDDREFRIWAQNRARHALGLQMEIAKDGTLTVKKV